MRRRCIACGIVSSLTDVGITNLCDVSVGDAKEWANEKELTPAEIATCDFAYAAYLMNIDLSNQPELQIVGIKETESGWLIKITATAGESNIDLGNINGTIKVKAAATLAELATAEADAYSIEVAGDSSVITKVTNDNNNFMRAMVTK